MYYTQTWLRPDSLRLDRVDVLNVHFAWRSELVDVHPPHRHASPLFEMKRSTEAFHQLRQLSACSYSQENASHCRCSLVTCCRTTCPSLAPTCNIGKFQTRLEYRESRRRPQWWLHDALLGHDADDAQPRGTAYAW
jgi:hypothetical protein